MKPCPTQIALQMWTVREEVQRDYRGTLARIAQMGYRGIEHVHSLGYGGLSPVEVSEQVAELELKTAGLHITLEQWMTERENILAYARALGTSYVVVAWVSPEYRLNEAAYRRLAEALRRIALECERNSLKLLYHHHDYEFVSFNGQYGLDLLLECVGAEHLGVEVDVHWVKRGGEEPEAYLSKVGPRCPLIHLKDLATDFMSTPNFPKELAFVPLGSGCLDFAAIVGAALFAEWYIVEQDYGEGCPIQRACINLLHLKKIGLAA